MSIVKAPHVNFIVYVRPSLVSPVEWLVPGAMVYGMPQGTSLYTPRPGRRRVRWDVSASTAESWKGDGPEPDCTRVLVATHGAYLVERFLTANGFPFKVVGDDRPIYIDRNNAELKGQMIESGRAALHELEGMGWLRKGWASKAYDRQAEGVGWTLSGLPCMLAVWPGGSGKTILTHLVNLTKGHQEKGAMLVIAPGNTRLDWFKDFKMVSDLEPFVCMAKSDGGGGVALLQYIDRMDNRGQPPVIVLGRDRLAEWYNATKSLQIATVTIDEIDESAPSSSMYRNVRYLADGSVEVTSKRTDKRGSINRGAAFVELMSRLDIGFRMGLTATPLNKGVPDKVWPIFNLLWPGSMGYGDFNFKMRYCGGEKNDHGFWEFNRGTNQSELAGRFSCIMHHTDYAETHGHLKPIEYRLMKVDKDSQDRSAAKTRFSDDLTWHQAMRKAAKKTSDGYRDEGLAEDDEGNLDSVSSYELSRMYACAIKRTAVTSKAVEHAVSGGRVAIGVGRKKEAREWAEACAQALKKKTPKGVDVPGVFVATGNDDIVARKQTVDAWRQGPGILIITYRAMGRGVDGMQHCEMAIAAQLPGGNAAILEQFFKRFDRMGRDTSLTCYIAAAEGTSDMDDLQRLAVGYDWFRSFLGDGLYGELSELLEDKMSLEEAVNDFLADLW